VLHPSDHLEHQPILFILSLLQCFLDVFLTVAFLSHEVLEVLKDYSFLEDLFPYWSLEVHLFIQLDLLGRVFPSLEVYSHLIADVMQDSVCFIHILFIAVQCSEFKLSQVSCLPSLDEVVQYAVDVLS
jgi:hypothetical protein